MFKENQKEDFIKEMPLVADYCRYLKYPNFDLCSNSNKNQSYKKSFLFFFHSKLASLPKEIYKSDFLRNFFRSNSVSPVEPTITKKNAENSTENKTKPESTSNSNSNSNPNESPTENTSTTLSNNLDQSKNKSPANSINTSQSKPKNVVVSVASLMNQNLKQNDKPPQHQLTQQQYHQNLNKMIQMNQLPPQFSNPVYQQLHLHTFQPITNMAIASPPCASPTPLQQMQNFNQSHSLNNSRSSSPWMMMPPPALPVNASTQSLQYFNQNRVQTKPNPKDSKNNHQDELLLRYALDNNNSNSPMDESVLEKSLNKPQKQAVDYRKNSLNVNKTKPGQNDAVVEQTNFGTMSPKSSSNNLRSSSSCSSSSYQTPPPQPIQALPVNLTSIQPKQLSSPSTSQQQQSVAAYNASMQQFANNYQQQQQSMHHQHPLHLQHHHNHHNNNPHLIPQIMSLQQQNKQNQAQAQPSLLLAAPGVPLPFALPPQIPIAGPNLSIVTSSFSSLNNNLKGRGSGLNSPCVATVGSNAVGSVTTSDDEEIANSELDNNSTKLSNQRVNNVQQRVQRKSVSSSSSSNVTVTNKQAARVQNVQNKNISLTSPGGTNQQIQTSYYYTSNDQQAKLMSPAEKPAEINDKAEIKPDTADTSNQTQQNGHAAKSPPVTSHHQQMPMNQVYYPPYIIDGPNVYTIANGTQQPHQQQLQQQQFNSYQQGAPIPFHHMAPHLHHPGQIQQMSSASAPAPFFIPIIPPMNAATASNNTPTPGSSPNPAPTMSQQLSASEMKTAQMMPQFQIPSQQFINNQDQQQLLNPFNFHHMMAIANAAVASSNTPNQIQQQQMSSMNPNMFMMMMMANPQAPLNPHKQIPAGMNFAQYQHYHSLSTPPPSQVSPSVNTFASKTHKKSPATTVAR